ncbi:hypothetical protein BC834DRAFT_966739 [Gloeopeniophorella convolvens]|nr:hypothetical protein BC834DRAFT_966739 [Gloeopeniophorella convolvens]
MSTLALWSTLPTELSCKILNDAWNLPLSASERRDLLVALPLVCRTFYSIASRLFLQDVHIVSPAYAAHFLSLLQHEALPSSDHCSPFGARAHPARSLCCSITFHIYNQREPSSPSGSMQIYSASNPTTRALESTLRALSRDAPARTLRRIALHYTDWAFTHELAHARLAHLPPQVRALELRFAAPAAAPLAQHLRQRYTRHFALPMPGVRSLSVFGTCPGFVADVAQACPALEHLHTDDTHGVLALQPRLRPLVALPAEEDNAQIEKIGPGQSFGEAPAVCALAELFEDMQRRPNCPQLSRKKVI